MTPQPLRHRRLGTAGLALLTITLVPGLAQLPALAASPTKTAASANRVLTPGDPVAGLEDLDLRGTALPSATQLSAASRLGAVDLRWNQFGTPSSILPADGVLAKATSSDPETAARSWLSSNASVFGLTSADVADLELVNSQRFAQSDARAVLFRQPFGELTPALGSMVTVGVANGEIAYASSSITKTTGTPAAAELSPVEAWTEAAGKVGRTVSAGDLAGITVDAADAGDDWTRLTVPGFAQEQQVRLRALALADGSVRPVFETNVVDVDKGSAFAYTMMVDAVDGSILHRQNQVEHSSDLVAFNGSIDGTECGEKHPFELTDNNTRQISIGASAANPANDIVIKLYGPGDELLAGNDLLTSPETLVYAPGGTIPQGIYNVVICPFDGTAFLPPTNYFGTVNTSDEESGGAAETTFPRWLFFPANPSLGYSATKTPSNNVVGCWVRGPGCTLKTGPLEQPWGSPWDYSTESKSSTQTTTGNNAQTREAWGSPLTPGGGQAPVSPTREYVDEFTDAWNNSKCNPAELHPTGNDIMAATTNLFVSHNRMHDYSYGLGFTERNYNLQTDNLGRGGASNDPEVGNVQAGAATGGAPSYLGRDNANQITLQDGTPGITNQYLFQPIAGAFYAPCADGSFDMSIVGHEYTHAITNRMIGGPDEGITSEQGGAMGESWGDLVAAEYLFSHGYSTGANPWAVGPYATGNRSAGIRDFPINRNPLNYSDYGFDSTGDEVHADGEIWNGTQFSVRQALVKKWNRQFPVSDKALQLRCAQGSATRSPLPASQCPGNRRWVQLMFDSFLLQQGATSMLDARDAMLAADRMRFGGKDVKAMWGAFAKRGMGKGASTPNADSGAPKPSFASPRAKNATVKFRTPGAGKLFVGRFEARVTPVADTLSKSKLDNVVTLVPGRYEMLFVSKTRGFKRFTLSVKPGQRTTYRVATPRNLAAAGSGAKVIKTSAGSLNTKFLIDGTENSAWGGVTSDNVDKTHPFVTVDLAGGVHKVRRVQVSAMLNPAPAGATDVPLAADPDSGSRFTALRRFALEACVANCSSAKATWKRFFTSRANAFPAVLPRPVAPNLNLRSFAVPPTRAAAIRFVVLENQCTGFKGYAGEQDEDPANDTDCKSASDRGTIVHAAELQVY